MSNSLVYASPASGHLDNRAWSSPPCRTEAITVLLEGVDRYNVQNLQLLEDYLVQDQVENDAYDCLANLAILKLYQFNPESTPQQEVDTPFTPFLILLKAIAHEPLGPDYGLCMALLGDQLTPIYSTPAVREGYAQIAELAKLLSARRFPQFWEKFNNDDFAPLQSTLEFLPAFSRILRRSLAVAAIQPSFRVVPRSTLFSWFGMTEGEDAEELEALIAELGWEADGNGEVVRVPENEDNAPRGSIAREPLTFDKLGKLLKQSSIAQA